MNCEACKEQVLELIDRERIDPRGVAEILARCPDCRLEFEKLKAVLQAVSELPLEDPSAAVDAAILHAAAARAPEVVPRTKRRFQAPPWAMAAIALLAVGLGVWTIPREVETEGDDTAADTKEAPELRVAETSLDDGEDPAEQVADRPPAVAARGVAASEEATSPRVADAAARRVPSGEHPRSAAKKAAVEPRPSERRREIRADEMEESDLVEAAPAAVEPARAGGSSTVAMADEDAEACRRTVEVFQRRRRQDAAYAPTAEEALTLGRCHQTLGHIKEARRWLRRAAAEPETKTRAEAALQALEAE